MTSPSFPIRHSTPTAVGAGLVALDIVINGRSAAPVGLWAGGTCGNVMTILAYLGWKSFPIARLKNDEFADDLIRDVRKWKVSSRFLSKSDTGSTPIIVERIGKAKDGTPRHRFEWNCPTCGALLPGYRAVLTRDTNEIIEQLPTTKAFFFDRVARSSVDLAAHCRKQGALVLFEPTSVKDERLFNECLANADIVKYSSDHAGRLPSISKSSGVLLEIETFGAEGLRYRCAAKPGDRSRWTRIGGYEIDGFKDAVGSGDWLSAGLIHRLGQSGRSELKRASVKKIEAALEFGQALAAVNCQFEGARGSMYGLSKTSFKKAVSSLLEFGEISDFVSPAETLLDEARCPECPSPV